MKNDTDESTPQTEPKRKRGFAALSREQVQAIAKKGGIAAHAYGTAHKWTLEEAKAAGSKGGTATRKKLSVLRNARQQLPDDTSDDAAE